MQILLCHMSEKWPVARLQAIGVLMVRASPSPAYRGKEEMVEEGLDAVLGCSAILPLTLLPRMLDPHPEVCPCTRWPAAWLALLLIVPRSLRAFGRET